MRDAVRLAVVVGALGVVFGDIGTSPIYTLQTVFNPHDPHPVPVSQGNVFGVVSLVFWSVMIIVTVTYVLLAMRADNDGEGGIMSVTVGSVGSSRSPRILAAPQFGMFRLVTVLSGAPPVPVNVARCAVTQAVTSPAPCE